MRTVILAALLLLHADSSDADTPQTEQDAIDALRGIPSNLQKNRDGTVRFVRFSKAIVNDDHLARVSAFSQLDYLAVVVPSVTDKGLRCVTDLNNLDTLILSDSGISDTTLRRIKRLDKLERLYADRTAVTDVGIQQLSQLPSLKILSLAETAITDSSLVELSRITTLETLDLSGTEITDSGLINLSQLSQLKTLFLNDTSVSIEGIMSLKDLPMLQVLEIRSTKSRGDARDFLTAAKSLRHLDARETGVNILSISELLSARKTLTVSVTPTGSNAIGALQRYLSGQPLRGVKSSPHKANPDGSVRAPDDALKTFLHSEYEPNFQRHVVPLLSRLGCNGRVCHGSFQGKGGFTLSMFGYDFAADLSALTAGDEPRVDTSKPELSLILNKPTSDDNHGGGQRFEKDGSEYQLLANWIRHGAKGVERPAKLVRFEVTPAEIVFQRAGENAQLKCVAVWENGISEDVTSLTRFRTNDEAVAEVSEDGLVTCRSPGDTDVVSFYDNGIFSTQVLMPVSDLTGTNYPNVSTPTEIDRLVLKKLSRLGIQPSDLCNDLEFLRRVSLDLAGTLPSPAEVESFLTAPASNKRRLKIEELLASDAYATWWAVKLSDLTGSNAQSLGSTDMNSPASAQWNAWLKRRLEDNVGWDQIAAGIILATSRRPGQTWDAYSSEQSLHMKRNNGTDFSAHENPMHYYWFRSNNQSDTDRALTFGYTFMGVRLQCAQCHKHPFDRWSKQDFDKFAAFFSRVKTGIAPDALAAQSNLKTKLGVPKKLDTAALRRQMYLRVSAEGLPIPWNEVWLAPPPVKPTTAKIPGGEEFDLNDFADPREPLMEWLTRSDNPYFAPAFVNRVWAHYFGIGIVDPPDDFNMANPPSNKALLSWLSDEFIRRKYDIRWLHRTITSSDAYQRSSQTTVTNRTDERNFSRSIVRRMPAEVTIDAVLRATARDDLAAKYLVSASSRKIGQHPKSYQARGIDYSLLVFGKPRRTTSCDCERQDQPTLLQSLYARNDTEMIGWLERADGWLMSVAREIGQPLISELSPSNDSDAAQPTPHLIEQKQTRELIRAAYLRTLTREPNASEYETAQAHITNVGSTIEGLRDIMWGLLNTPEFLTNH